MVTARAGTPLTELAATLAEKGQWLAFEPPYFGPAATVGGMLASAVVTEAIGIHALFGAFLFGAVSLFGARLAGGCTSGHGISGGLQLALSSWVFFIAIGLVANPNRRANSCTSAVLS